MVVLPSISTRICFRCESDLSHNCIKSVTAGSPCEALHSFSLTTIPQGLFMAPSIVGESLKGAELVAEVMQNKLGLPCNPPPGSHRTDIIQAVQCGTRKKVIRMANDYSAVIV